MHQTRAADNQREIASRPGAPGRASSRLRHPLSGSDLRTLLALLGSNGPVSPRALPTVGVVLLAALLRWPFSSVERMRVAYVRRRSPPVVHGPVFIVGHWRTGTTHLYNMLAASGQFGYVSPFAAGLPWDMLGLARVLRPFLERAVPSHRLIDDVPVTPDAPQEDEIALASMTTPSFYHGLYFPRRLREHIDRGLFFERCSAQEVERWKRTFVYFIEKVAMDQGARALLVKNPAHTARVALLRELFPNAKFIHLKRNPYLVFASMKNFYDKLLRALALQRYDEQMVEDVILDTYSRMMHRLLRDSRELPSGSFADVRFENLEARPLQELERVYGELGLEGFDEARPRIRAYLARTADYRKNRYRLPARWVRCVQWHWRPFIDEWGYAAPPEARSP